VKTIDVGEYPEGISTHPDDRHVYVANWFSNEVSVIDSRKLKVIKTIATGEGSRAFGQFIGAGQSMAR
jgi:YVTN family beta-propeller protein